MLGILGLGADGHLASLFRPEDLRRGGGRYAIAVPRDPGPDRVSVTRELLLLIERLVFLVVGAEKAEVVKRAEHDDPRLTAIQGVRGAKSVELWFSE
jgi:6-phosphogluconolactonase/glucosamine-6-phosphate isomerase/deaminase